MILNVATIPHSSQRYDTVGDYWESEGVTHFRVSSFPDKEMGKSLAERCEWLVLVHEVVEYTLVKLAGINLSDIDRFDKAFEAKRASKDVSEPGDDPASPYFHQHQAATAVERVLAVLLGVSWKEYENAVIKLSV